MSFPRYPKYKDSGVEWLGPIPEHWGTSSLRWLTRRYSGGTPDKTNLDFWENGSIPWLNSGAVNDRLITKPSAYISDEAFQRSSAKWIPSGALVMALAGQGKTKGMVAQLLIDSTCNQSMAAIIPQQGVDARFLFWWLDSNYENIRNLAGGDLRDGLNLELLGNILCPLMPVEEQQAIARFLDRETTKIDALIAEQERLIELLKEKRQAFISHAVTKGLDPNVPMKPSGVEWLGDVPAHWLVTSIGRYASVENGTTPDRQNPAYWHAGTVPWVSSGEVNQGHVAEPSEFITEQALAECSLRILPIGTVLVGLVGQGKTRGASARLAIEACINQNLAAILFRDRLTPAFGYFVFQATYDHLREQGRGGNQAALNCEILRAQLAPVPPIAEQIAIAGAVEHWLSRSDAILEETQRAISLLQERRSALISAAVTGQIDVRADLAALG